MAGIPPEPRLEILPDADAVGRRAAEIFAHQIGIATSQRGRALVALSRPTPWEAFRWVDAIRFGHAEFDVFQVDERRAPLGGDDRNLTLIERHLPSWAARGTIHQMPVHVRPLSRGARRYARDIESICGRPPVLDVVHLGLGPDGHTASLLPGDPALDVTDAWVASTRKHGGFWRLTMTYPVLALARLVVFVVTGEQKAEALARVVQRDPALPASHVAADAQLFLVDRAAAARLP